MYELAIFFLLGSVEEYNLRLVCRTEAFCTLLKIRFFFMNIVSWLLLTMRAY